MEGCRIWCSSGSSNRDELLAGLLPLVNPQATFHILH